MKELENKIHNHKPRFLALSDQNKSTIQNKLLLKKEK